MLIESVHEGSIFDPFTAQASKGKLLGEIRTALFV